MEEEDLFKKHEFRKVWDVLFGWQREFHLIFHTFSTYYELQVH